MTSPILEKLAEAPRPLSRAELAEGTELKPQQFDRLLERLQSEGEIYQNKSGKYALPHQINLVVGWLDVTSSGSGFVVPHQRQPDQPDLFVPAGKLATAVHGDKVVARLEGRRKGRGPKGSVIKILERARRELVGLLKTRGDRFGLVKPDNPKLPFDVYIPAVEARQAKSGQKVVVFIENWGDGRKSPEGSIVEVLGFPDQPGVDVLSLIKGRGLEQAFPEEVEAEASKLSLQVPQKRLDLRDLKVFTIDPATAQDFDDAFSLERLENGTFRIGVHIADVSHFVRPGTALDEEASRRATSVYLVDRVVPMLPEALSNGLCSLKPDEDRLAYSVLMTLDEQAQVMDHEFRETVIRSRFRLTYREAQDLLESEPTRPDHKELLFEVQTLRRLAKILKARRSRRGSLDFDLPAAVIDLDEAGCPLDVRESVRLDSMRLVEEFMLLANELVASHAHREGLAFLYRVHDQPAPGKLENVQEFLTALGYRRGSVSFDEVLTWANGRPEEELVTTVLLRSMEAARYQTKDLGHFGLAAPHYTHFTSPIRRYPDLVVHRLLKGQQPGCDLDTIAAHASKQERVALDVERDSVALKKAEYLGQRLGQTFGGVISGVQSFGFFVRLDCLAEGMVSVHDLSDDHYQFLQDELALEGRNTGRRFRLGDRVEVTVQAVDKASRKVDLSLV